ncbi:MAG: acetyl-CoA carboxylase carboxyltransferase subunit beta [Eubacteriales bacterium]|nr:acetyl-CoA carboxylase carboxyltransferase subunit beta [Eubacteriales bacterium]
MADSLNKHSGILRYIKSLRKKNTTVAKEVENPIFVSCQKCKAINLESNLTAAFMVCPNCGHHLYLEPESRFTLLFDNGYTELTAKANDINPLNFPGYAAKRKAQNKPEAIRVVKGEIGGHETIVICMDKDFFMGSMGSYVGEMVVLAFQTAIEEKLPVIAFSQSGGARMQEGIIALMQMAKTAEIIGKFHQAGGFFLSCFTDPTTGGVSASFASLGDFLIAEPNALICFSGPRVIRDTIKQELPKGFQRAEFLLKEGLLDDVVPRNEMKQYIQTLLKFHAKKETGGNHVK